MDYIARGDDDQVNSIQFSIHQKLQNKNIG